MAVRSDRLYAAIPNTTADFAAAIVPSGERWLGKSVTLFNGTGLPAQIKIGLRIANAGATIWRLERTVAAGGSVEVDNLFWIWQATDGIRVQPTTAAAIHLSIDGAKLVL